MKFEIFHAFWYYFNKLIMPDKFLQKFVFMRNEGSKNKDVRNEGYNNGLAEEIVNKLKL